MPTIPLADAVSLAEQHLLAGRVAEAEEVCRSILRAVPDAAAGHRLLALAAYQQGRPGEAEESVRRSLALDPGEPTAHDNLALYLLALGRPAESAAAAGQALARKPDFPGAANNLGLAMHALGRLAEAERAFRRAVELQPGFALAWANLGGVLLDLGRPADAVTVLDRALELAPGFPLALDHLARLGVDGGTENNRGVELLAAGRYSEAEACFRRGLLARPDLPELHYNLGNVLRARGKADEAVPCYREALRLRPAFTRASVDLAEVLAARREPVEEVLRRAVELDPDNPEAWNSLGLLVLTYQGRPDEARAAYDTALSLRPDYPACHSNLLLNEQYRPGVTEESLAALHADWERRHAEPLYRTRQPHPNPPGLDRPLRVGFVSADLSYHPVGFFLAPVLDRLPRDRWQTVCYSAGRSADGMTARLRAASGAWRDVAQRTDAELADLIRADGIDLLIDLAGHTGGNRLPAFARRPAPVQLTWAGYVGTTGLAAIDYLIADRHHVPPGSESHYRERVLRMPAGYICYEPPDYAPPVGPLPALAVGHITFGCFNSTAKLNPDVVACWTDVLSRVPRSTLVLKYHWLSRPEARALVRERFAAAGLDPDRVELHGSTTHGEQLDLYNRVDVALDPFPYGGGLTTCEALWMGVPVVTFPGRTFASRHATGHQTNAGFTDAIAADRAGYVARAVELAGDLSRLAGWRAELRARVAASPLCDADRFAADFADVLRGAWREWCRTAR